MLETIAPPAKTLEGFRSLANSFLELHPDEVALTLERTSVQKLLSFLEECPIPTVARLLPKLNPDVSSEVLEQMTPGVFDQVLTQIDPQKVASILARLSPENPG